MSGVGGSEYIYVADSETAENTDATDSGAAGEATGDIETVVVTADKKPASVALSLITLVDSGR